MAGYAYYRKKRNRVYIICGISAFVILLVVAIAIVINSEKKNIEDSNGTTQFVSKVENVYNKSEDIMVNLSDKKATLDYENAASNKDYIKYSVKLAETGEILYESKLLAPGEKLGEVLFDLPENITTGTYDIKLYIETFEKTTDKDSSQAIIQKLKLKIK